MAIQIKKIPLVGKYFQRILIKLFESELTEEQTLIHLEGKYPGELIMISLPGDVMVMFKTSDIEIKIGTKYSLDYFMVETKNIKDHNYYFLVNVGKVFEGSTYQSLDDYWDLDSVKNHKYYEILYWLMGEIVEMYENLKFIEYSAQVIRGKQTIS